MNRYHILGIAAAVLLPLSPGVRTQEPETRTAQIRVLVPADARVDIDGKPTRQTGETRLFVTPPLPVDRSFEYTIKATWVRAGRVLPYIRVVKVTPGEETLVDLRNPPPGDDETVQVIYVPTPQEVVEKMLELAGVGPGDVVYDLGCGDGRIVVTAAKKFGCKGVGVDLDPERIKESRENVKQAGVEELVEIRQGDALKVDDIGKATVVTLYMLPEFNRRLAPILQAKLRPGSRVVSHDYLLGDWKPDQNVTVKGPRREHYLYLWRVEGPAKP
jgi:uncharacterized protein (TIGR03000 family)